MKSLLELLAQISPTDIKSLPQPALRAQNLQDALRMTFGIAGGIAVIIIVLAALRYVYSLGDSAGVAQARKAIIYALVGLVVCIVAYNGVGFVISNV